MTVPSLVKRPRRKKACNTCRDGKTRCDGLRPIYSTCRRRGFTQPCGYDGSVSYISALENRVRHLEGELQARKRGNPARFPAVSMPDRIDAEGYGLVTTSPLTVDRGGRHGPSSTIAFARSISRSTSTVQESSTVNSRVSSHDPDLLDSSWTSFSELVHPGFPILHRPNTESFLRASWESAASG